MCVHICHPCIYACVYTYAGAVAGHAGTGPPLLAAGAGGFGTVNITAKASAKIDVSQEEVEGAVAWLDKGTNVLEILPRSHAVAKLTFHVTEPAQLAEKSELIDVAVNNIILDMEG